MSNSEPTDFEIRLVAAADHLRETIARQRLLAPEVRAGSLGPQRFSDPVSQVGQAAVVNPHLPIAWPHWPPGILPKLTAALQKVTRRLLAWYINPIVAQQNAFNYSVLRALQDAERANQQLTDRLTDLERHYLQLSDRLDASDRAPRGQPASASRPTTTERPD